MTKPISGRHIQNQSASRQSKAFIIVIVMSISIISMLIIYYNIRRINDGFHIRLEKGLTLAETILPQALWQLNYDYLDDFISGIFIDDIFVYVRIAADETTLAEYYRPGTEKMSFQEFQQSPVFIAQFTDIFYDGKLIGCIEMAVSNKGIYKELIFNSGVAFTIMAILVIGISKYYKKLTETREQYLALYENTIEGIYQTTPEGCIIRANPAMAKILGYDSPYELVQTVNDLSTQVYVNPEDRAEIIRIVGKKGIVSDYETPFYRKDKSVIWVSLSARAVRDASGKIILLEGWLVDITERIEKEKAERDRRTAEVLAKAKSEFLANMSHEIRTPLNAIIGLSDLAMKTEMTQKQRDYTEKIWASAKILTNIIDNILDFSKIEAGKIKIESAPFHIDDIINTVADMFAKPVVENNNEMFIDIDKNIPDTLIGDSLRLSQILINLVSNAVKFTINGEILLKISRMTEKSGNSRSDLKQHPIIRFSVSDTGIGIHQEQIAKLFTPFTQIDSSMTRKFGGAGLGLVICQRLVEFMGGDIFVESRPEKGTVFSFSLKFGSPLKNVENRTLSVPGQYQGMRILAVDDHPESLNILSELLRYFTFLPDAASSIDDAFRQLHQKDVNLILIDERMIKSEGERFVSLIRNEPALSLTPIIIMAGFGKEDVIRQMYPKDGKISFITKPVTRSSILKLILSVFESSSKEITEDVFRKSERTPFFMGKNILLVEDNVINQQVAAEILQNEGFRVAVACNGEEAVGYIRQSHFDAVLMDIQMPVMDGLEATRKIRSMTCHSGNTKPGDAPKDQLPIIAMTAHALKEDKEKCFAAGMNDYITKPIDTVQLMKILQTWIPGITITLDNSYRPDPAGAPFFIEGIDTESALQRMGGNLKLFRKLLSEFSSEYGNTSEIIGKALVNNQTDIALHWVHTIKGVAGNISASELYSASLSLEKSIKENDFNSVGKRMHQFQTAFDNLMTAVKIFENGEKNADALNRSGDDHQLSDMSEIADHMKTLSEMLIKNNPRSEQVTEALKIKLRNTPYYDDIKQLDDLINRFNFKASMQLLNKIANAMQISF